VVEPELEEVAGNLLTDKSLDSRVEIKLAQMEAGDIQPGAKGKAGGAMLPSNDGDDEDDDDDVEKKKDDGEDKTKDDEGKKPVAKTGSAIDPDKLPEDIKRSILSAKQMDEGQLNGVLSELSDAVMKSLKRAGVKETEIFGLVAKINNAAFRILTGEPPPPPAPKKKESKK
jgi:hypothetical protein